MRRPSRFRISLLASVAAIVSLTACDSAVINSITGKEDRMEQRISGPRRAPLLNPAATLSAPVRPDMAAPAVSTRGGEDSPFDRYDARGEVSALAPKPLEMPAADEEKGEADSGLFDRLIPSREAVFGEKKDSAAIRKPFVGNMAASNAPAPVMLAPAEATEESKPAAKPVSPAKPKEKPKAKTQSKVQKKPEPEPKLVASTPVQEPITLDATPDVKPEQKAIPLSLPDDRDTVTGFVPLPLVPAADPQVVAAPAHATEMASVKIAQQPSEEVVTTPTKSDEVSQDAPVIQPAQSVQGADRLPPLSSVPSAPERFEQVKSTSKDEVAALIADHDTAQQHKQALEQEPSELVQPSAAAATPSETPGGAKPPATMLGRISDPKLADSEAIAPLTQQPAPVEYAEDTVVEAVKTDAPPPAASTPAARLLSAPASWWKRVTGEASVAAEAQTSNHDAVPVLFKEEPVTTVAPFVPAAASETPEKQPEASTKEDESEEPKPNTGSLPSPSKLQDINTLPPTRYQERPRQYQLVP